MSDALNISDGDITIDFADPNSGYVLVAEGYQPAVAQEDPNRPERTLPVDEEFRLYIDGSSPADAASKLEDLTEIVHRAARLWRGEIADPVIYQYQIANSTLNAPLKALVIGAPEGNSILELPAGYDSATMTSKIGSATDPIIWRLRRRGDWLDEEDSASSSSGQTGGIHSVTLAGGTLTKRSPVDLGLAFSQAAATFPFFYLFVGDRFKIAALDAGNGDFTSAPDGFTVTAVTNAFGGNVLEFNAPTANDLYETALVELENDLDEVKRFHVFIKLRNNHASTQFDIYARFLNTFPSSPVEIAETETFTIDNETTDPRMLYFGLVSMHRVPKHMSLVAQATSTSGELQVDEVVLVSDTDAQIFSCEEIKVPSSTDLQFKIDHNLLSDPKPRGYFYNSSVSSMTAPDPQSDVNTAPIVKGLTPLLSKTAIFYAVFFSLDPIVSSNWRWEVSATLQQITATAVRRPAYRVPR